MRLIRAQILVRPWECYRADMIELGHRNELTIAELVPYGAMLTDGDELVLLPQKFVTPEMDEGQTVDVFIHTDSEDKLVATTQEPLAVVGEFKALKVVDTTRHGAFLNWGLDKDLFLPNNLQHQRVRVGQSVVVAVFIDERTERIAASSKLGEFFSYEVDERLKEGSPVDCIVYGENELGISVIVDERYSGLIYRGDAFAKLEIGQKVSAFVLRVREDNKIDISLHPTGMKKLENAVDIVLDALNRGGGFLALHDKSPADEIAKQLSISKKAFKSAVGILYKERRVELKNGGVQLVTEETDPDPNPSGSSEKRR